MSLYSPIPWNLNRTVGPTAPVVTVAELKDHLRVKHATEDDYIERLGLGAEEVVEDELSAAFLTQTYVLRLDWFPYWEIRLPRPPLQSVTSVQYIDTDGVTQVLATSEYVVGTPPTNSKWRAVPGRIYPAYGETWPSTRDEPNAVIITYVAGVTTAAAVPDAVRQAVKMAVADAYEHREMVTDTIVNNLPVYGRLVANHRCVDAFEYK